MPVLGQFMTSGVLNCILYLTLFDVTLL